MTVDVPSPSSRPFSRLETVQLPSSQWGSKETFTWWCGLPFEMQYLMIVNYSHAIRNRDGIPYAVRDLANRNVLRKDMENVRLGNITGAVRHTIEKTWEVLTSGVNKLPLTLVLYRPQENKGNGHVVVGVGDVTNAKTFVVLVPGFRGTVKHRLKSLTTNVESLLSTDFGCNNFGAGFAWIGYSSPTWNQLSSFTPGWWGASALAKFVDGIHAISSSSSIRVVGHSYGGVVACLAPSRTSHIDAIVCAGAPGAPLIADPGYSCPPIYSVVAEKDVIANSHWFDYKIEKKAFTFSPTDTPQGHKAKGHHAYFKPGTVTVQEIARLAFSPTITETAPNSTLKKKTKIRFVVSRFADLSRRYAPTLNEM